MISLMSFSVASMTVLADYDNMIMPSGGMRPAEYVIEYGSRICYDSLSKLGTNPNFIAGLIKAGHLDVLEHASVTFSVCFLATTEEEVNLINLKLSQIIVQNRHIGELKLFFEHDGANGDYRIQALISANIRTWLEIILNEKLHSTNIVYQYIASPLYTYLSLIAPSIFNNHNAVALAHTKPVNFSSFKATEEVHYIINNYSLDRKLSPIVTSTGASVYLLAYSRHVPFPNYGGIQMEDLQDYRHMTFLVTGASRAFSHQHVRHRLLSFSQTSQRYVDFVSKQNGKFIMPPNLTPEQESKMLETFEYIKESYLELRNLGVKKEDARAVLPNAAETSLVFSGYKKGLEHYIKLRTATDAQQEIREIAVAVETLYRDIYVIP